MNKMVKRKYNEKDPVLEILEKRQERFGLIKKIFIVGDNWTIRFVINEKQFRFKKKQKQKYMKDIEKEFSGKTLIKIPLLDSDMNKNTIDRLAEYFII